MDGKHHDEMSFKIPMKSLAYDVAWTAMLDIAINPITDYSPLSFNPYCSGWCRSHTSLVCFNFLKEDKVILNAASSALELYYCSFLFGKDASLCLISPLIVDLSLMFAPESATKPGPQTQCEDKIHTRHLPDPASASGIN